MKLVLLRSVSLDFLVIMEKCVCIDFAPTSSHFIRLRALHKLSELFSETTVHS